MQTTDVVEAPNKGWSIIVDDFIGQGKDMSIDRSDIRPSKTNRKFFNPVKLKELAANIKAVGILQRILVRPVTPTEEEPEQYEIVYGERRWLAAGIAELVAIPCNVRSLNDDQAAMIQIFENLHKENPHPLEEAMGYQNLMMAHGYTADALVKELGLTRSYFYGRLKLCSLAADLHQDFMNDKFPASIALIIARIPVPALQIEAANEILDMEDREEPMSVREASSFIRDRYMLNLDKATFPTSYAKLIDDAGSCDKCPKRTGNQPEMYEGIDPQICTDPNCFSEKTAAVVNKKIAVWENKNIPVHRDNEGRMLLIQADFGNHGKVSGRTTMSYFNILITPGIRMQSMLHDVLTPDQRPKPVFMVLDRDNELQPVYNHADAQMALKNAGHCPLSEAKKDLASDEDDEDDDTDEEQDTQSTVTVTTISMSALGLNDDNAIAARTKRDDERRETASKETKARVAIYKRLRELVAEGLSLPSLREFAKQLFISHSLPNDVLYDIYQFDINDDEQVWAYIDQATMVELQLFLLDLILTDDLVVTSWNMDRLGSESDTFNTVLAIARAEGIDPDQVRYELENPAAVAQSDEPAQQAIKTPAKRGRKPKVAAQPQPDLIAAESDAERIAEDQASANFSSQTIFNALMKSGSDVADANAPAPVDMPPVKTPGKRGPKPKQKESDSAAQAKITPVEAWPFPKGVA